MSRYAKGSGYIDFVGAEEHFWRNETLWEAASSEPIEQVSLDALPWHDDGCNTLGSPPTWGALAEHCKRVWDADMNHPIICGPTGDIVDGMHRIIRTYIEGRRTIACVTLREMPPPDEVHPRVDFDGLKSTVVVRRNKEPLTGRGGNVGLRPIALI